MIEVNASLWGKERGKANYRLIKHTAVVLTQCFCMILCSPVRFSSLTKSFVRNKARYKCMKLQIPGFLFTSSCPPFVVFFTSLQLSLLFFSYIHAPPHLTHPPIPTAFIKGVCSTTRSQTSALVMQCFNKRQLLGMRLACQADSGVWKWF